MTFRLAPMSPSILVLTVVLLALPLALLGLAALLTPLLLGPAVFILAIYVWVWLATARPRSWCTRGPSR